MLSWQVRDGKKRRAYHSHEYGGLGPVDAIGMGHVVMSTVQGVVRGVAAGWPPVQAARPPGRRTGQPEGPRLGAHGAAPSLGRLSAQAPSLFLAPHAPKHGAAYPDSVNRP